MNVNGDTKCNWGVRYGHRRMVTGTGGFGNKRSSGDHPNYRIFKIRHNTKKGAGDSRRLTVSQTPVEKLSANAEIKILEGVSGR